MSLSYPYPFLTHLHSLFARVLLAIGLVIFGALGIFLVHPSLFNGSAVGNHAAALLAAFRPFDGVIEDGLRGQHLLAHFQRLTFLV